MTIETCIDMSASMEPTIKNGSLVRVRDANDLRRGDIAVGHRVISISIGDMDVQTKGDSITRLDSRRVAMDQVSAKNNLD